MRLGAPRAVTSTIGQANPSPVDSRKPYEWRGIPGWQPGAPELRETEARRPGPPPDFRSSAEAKAARFAAFCAAREAEPDGSVAAAGRVAGVTSKTAQAYERERKQQQRGESRNG